MSQHSKNRMGWTRGWCLLSLVVPNVYQFHRSFWPARIQWTFLPLFLLWLAVGLPRPVLAADTVVFSSQLSVAKVYTVKRKSLGKTATELSFRIALRNGSALALTDVTASLVNLPEGITVVDGDLTLPALGPGKVLRSADTASLRIPKGTKLNLKSLTWQFNSPTLRIAADEIDLVEWQKLAETRVEGHGRLVDLTYQAKVKNVSASMLENLSIRAVSPVKTITLPDQQLSFAHLAWAAEAVSDDTLTVRVRKGYKFKPENLLLAFEYNKDATAAQATVGTAGGTVTVPGGAQVVIPQDVLATDTVIGVDQAPTDAPPLPVGMTAFGPIVAFTPHGTGFRIPATLSVPFDSSLVPVGTTPTLYKTNAAGAWEVVPGATINGNLMVGRVIGFSYATVAPAPNPTSVSQASEQWHYELKYTGSNPAKTDTVVLPTHENVDAPLLDYFPKDPGLDDPSLPGDPNLRLPITLHGEPKVWYGGVYATQSGVTFWADAVAPFGLVNESGQHIGLNTSLTVTRVMRKLTDTASTRAVFTEIKLVLIDGNPDKPSGNECPWQSDPNGTGDACLGTLVGFADLTVDGWYTLPNGGIVTLRHALARARIRGWRDHFEFAAVTRAASDGFVFDTLNFNVDKGTPDEQGQLIIAKLIQPITIDVPLDTVGKDGEFTVQITINSITFNRRQRESFSGVYMQDPAKSSGVAFEEQGVELVSEPVPRPISAPPPAPAPQPVPSCETNADPAAGTVQFSSATFAGFEQADANEELLVTRSGGSQGAVSVLLSAADGSAHAGVDYQALTSVVRFEDGEQGTRSVTIPIIDNDNIDGDRTVHLTLSQLGGCGSIGSPTTASLVIHDDDKPYMPPTYQVGGTITGLAGSGLVLRDSLSGGSVTPSADGAFVFPTTWLNGLNYDVSVQTQPNNPAQNCVLTNGTGTIADADVSNITVTCATVQANGALDPVFGTAGKVSAAQLPAGKATTLQTDGKILVVGGMKLSRFNPNGSIDTTFGTAGTVTLVADGGSLDAMLALAVQPDGMIVVAGNTSQTTGVNDNFAVQRYTTSGNLDTGFGTGGKVVTDFSGLSDRANAVLLQSDGKIVVTGWATAGPLVSANQDFAAVRYLGDGSLDTGFGSGGKATIDVAGNADTAQAGALQADGKIVIGGRVYINANAEPDMGLARLNADGTPDTGFGSGGRVRIDFSSGGAVQPGYTAGLWDEVTGIAVQTDTKLVLAGYTRINGLFRFALARLAADGTLDTGFGTGGLVSSAFSSNGDRVRAVTLQSDGRIVVAGQIGMFGTNPDWGIARYTYAGALDSSFDIDGLVQIDFFGAIDDSYGVLIQEDGKIVATGSAKNGSAAAGLALSRIVP